MADSVESEQKTQSTPRVEGVNEWTLGPNTEFRFELEKGSNLAIKLVDGEAEVFGAELAQGRSYLFGAECKASVFSWHGCQASTEYISEETFMTPILNLHLLLEQMRVRAHHSPNDTSSDEDEQRPKPPCVLVIGPENSGKTTATKILTNYAVRSPLEWQPMLVNLDTSDGGFTLPGTLSAASLDSTILASSPSTTLGGIATTAPTALSSSALIPLVYWFGYSDAKKSPAVMERRMKDLAARVREREELDQFGFSSGIIIDTAASFSVASPFSQTDQKYPLIKWAVEAFAVNVIVVMGHEKLNVEVQRLFSAHPSYNTDITVVKIPKSGGAVEIDHAYKERVHTHQIQSYFYGTHLFLPKGLTEASVNLGGEANLETLLSPYSSDVGFDELSIYRIGGETMAPSSALPIGSAAIVTELKPIKVDPGIPGSGLLNTVLALLSPVPHQAGTLISEELSDEEILDCDVTGFLIIAAIDIPNRKMTILSPLPGSLAGRIAVAGSFEWQDQ